MTATLSYKHKKFDFTDLHVRIVRAGQALVDQDIAEPAAPGGFGTRRSITALNIDRDAEPEVVVDINSEGAHCCDIAYVYDYSPPGDTYGLVKHDFVYFGYSLVDLGGDGAAEFLSGDSRFAYVFTAYAFSAFPVQIWQYRNGRFRDVTRRYPRRIRRDAHAQLLEFSASKRRHEDVRGVIAAYAADECSLGHCSKGFRFARRVIRHAYVRRYAGENVSPRRYLRKLRRFLRRKGYIR